MQSWSVAPLMEKAVQTVLRLPNDGELTLTWAQLVAPPAIFCTSTVSFRAFARAIGDDDNPVQIALQRTEPVVSSSARPRASLDEGAWSQLRARARRGRATMIDIKVASACSRIHRSSVKRCTPSRRPRTWLRPPLRRGRRRKSPP